MTDGDLIRGLQALGRQEREREERKKALRDMFERSYKDSHHQGWAAEVLQKSIARQEEEAKRQEFVRRCEEGEV